MATVEETVQQLTKKNYLRHTQKRRLAEERTRQEEQLRNPYVSDKGPVIKALRAISKTLSEQSPPTDLSGDVKNAILKRERDLATKITGIMQPDEDLRRCPDSSVPYNLLKQEGAIKSDILEWKACRILNNPEDEDPNLANADHHLRPKKGTTYSGLMANAMGPRGHMGYQNVPDENWKQALGPEPTADTALKQAKRHAEKEAKAKRTLSPEHKARMLEGAARARAAKAELGKVG